MTQPAFSQLIRELEVALRVKLFERTTHHIELTETGRRLLPMVEPPLEDLGDAFKFVRDMAAGTRGRITFASLPSVAFGLVTHALAHFKARSPAIAVRLTEDQNLYPDQPRASPRSRLWHRHTGNTAQGARIPRAAAGRITGGLPGWSRACRQPPDTWRDLAAESLVLLPRQSSVRSLVEHGFAVSGIACEPDYEVTNMVTALSMTRARLGITVMPRIALGELNTKGLRSSRINDPHPARSIGVITHADRPLSPAATAYVRLLLAATRNSAYNINNRRAIATV